MIMGKEHGIWHGKHLNANWKGFRVKHSLGVGVVLQFH